MRRERIPKKVPLPMSADPHWQPRIRRTPERDRRGAGLVGRGADGVVDGRLAGVGGHVAGRRLDALLGTTTQLTIRIGACTPEGSLLCQSLDKGPADW